MQFFSLHFFSRKKNKTSKIIFRISDNETPVTFFVNMELIKREFIVIHDIEKRANHSIPRTQYAVVIKHPRNLSSFRGSETFPQFQKEKKPFEKRIISKITHKKVFSFFLASFFCETVAPAFKIQFLIR